MSTSNTLPIAGYVRLSQNSRTTGSYTRTGGDQQGQGQGSTESRAKGLSWSMHTPTSNHPYNPCQSSGLVRGYRKGNIPGSGEAFRKGGSMAG